MTDARDADAQLAVDIERLELTLREVQRELSALRARSIGRRQTLRIGAVSQPSMIAPSEPPPAESHAKLRADARAETLPPPARSQSGIRRPGSDAGRYALVTEERRVARR